MGSGNLPSSDLDKTQEDTQIALLSLQLSLKGNLVSGRVPDGFLTLPWLLSPSYTFVPLHGETQPGWG